MKNGSTLSMMLRANLAFLFSPKTRGTWGHQLRGPVPVLPDFFGVCVASSEDPECDNYVVARLKELGLRCVRVDYGYDSPGSFVDRFTRRLVAEGFRVTLHLVAPRAEVEALTTPEGAERWRQFVRKALAAFGGAVEFFEIGSTVNRRRWSGFTMPLFLRAWNIAWEEAKSCNVNLAGPNVTDFEPFYNIALMRALWKRRQLPAVHTNNLFVERATEPEAFDHKILGHRLAAWIKYNSIKKATLLGTIGRWTEVSKTFSMHVSWSLRRIRRLLEDAEEQQADYVARYCALMAASGGLYRVYWGPLIGQREGLIDDGTIFFPEIFHVTFYGRANGKVEDYRIRPAFRAFQAVQRMLAGTTFIRQVPTRGSLEILEFQSATHKVHVVWCRNGDCAAVSNCYNGANAAEAFNRNGDRLNSPPGLFTQSPVYLQWKKETPVRFRNFPGTLAHVRVAVAHGQYAPVEHGDWRGLVLAQFEGRTLDTAALLPGRVAQMNSSNATILRNKRNRVWSVSAPWDDGQKVVVKHFRPAKGVRGWLQRFKPNKALRSWNGAHELLRRGIPTPKPVAWLEHPVHPRESENYYLCEAFEGATSARQAFYAFNKGDAEFLGTPAENLLRAIAAVVVNMHNRGIFFRDLSAGNLLLRPAKKGGVEFAFIDTGRVRIRNHGIPIRQRLADLMRLCHPLIWRERERFLPMYFEAAGVRFAPWMRVAFHYYDWKHRIKKKLRRR